MLPDRWTLRRCRRLLERAGIDPDGYGEERRAFPVNPLDAIPSQELGREEIDPDTWRPPTAVDL